LEIFECRNVGTLLQLSNGRNKIAKKSHLVLLSLFIFFITDILRKGIFEIDRRHEFGGLVAFRIAVFKKNPCISRHQRDRYEWLNNLLIDIFDDGRATNRQGPEWSLLRRRCKARPVDERRFRFIYEIGDID